MGSIDWSKYVEVCGSLVTHAPDAPAPMTATATAATKLAARMAPMVAGGPEDRGGSSNTKSEALFPLLFLRDECSRSASLEPQRRDLRLVADEPVRIGVRQALERGSHAGVAERPQRVAGHRPDTWVRVVRRSGQDRRDGIADVQC